MDMLSFALGRSSGGGGGGSNGNAYDFIITSEEQFLAERANFYGKKVLVKDVNFTLPQIDFGNAAYVEFCNVAVGSADYYATIKNFDIGNFIGLTQGWRASEEEAYYCDTLYIDSFTFVENLVFYREGTHGSGDCVEFSNGFGIMNCVISSATNCCNIINCHIIGRNSVYFSNCTSICNLHAKNLYSPDGVVFENCTHLSNIALTGAPVTYTNCSKVCADTCDGYNG